MTDRFSHLHVIRPEKRCFCEGTGQLLSLKITRVHSFWTNFCITPVKLRRITLCKLDYRINEVIIKCFSHFNWIINGRDGNISGAVECVFYLYISMVQPNNSLRAETTVMLGCQSSDVGGA